MNPNSTVEGSFGRDIINATSVEFEKTYAELSLVSQAGFAQTSWGEYLENIAEEHGVFRRSAVRAIGTVTVTGTGTVSQGALFQTQDGTEFSATSTVKVTASADVPVQAVEYGSKGNVAAGAITIIPMSIPGITRVTNAKATYDGFDEETDEELRERLLFKVRMPATSGNMNDYIEWGTSVEGVGHITVVPLWNGNGTVKLLVTDSNGQPASPELLARVTEKVESMHPIGATVSVIAPSVLGLTVALTPTKGGGDAAAIKKVLNAYFLSRQYTEKKVSYAKVGQLIIENADTTQVEDYDNLTINGATANIGVDTDQIPSVVEVVLNA
nr:MAG TPA_asm: Baseplate J like protein [Bacteriophage sp.]